MSKRKAPPGCFWRGDTLWGRIQVRGRDIKFSLRTNDPAIAQRRTSSSLRLLRRAAAHVRRA